MSNGRPVHFEIYVDDVKRAQNFYAKVFGWGYQDWSEVTGTPYWGVVTGEDDAPGINGGMLKRDSDAKFGGAPTSFVCTMEVENFDRAQEAVLANGGEVVTAKYPIPGMAWQGYFRDPEGNTFGLHQPDESAGK